MALTITAPTHDQADADRFGAVALRTLVWDTKHFGRKMGALTVDEGVPAVRVVSDVQRALAAAARDGYAHVMLRVAAERLEVAAAAERCGMRLVDVALDLVATHIEHRPTLMHARPAEPADLPTLRMIASSAFDFSRFATDPFFSAEEVAGLYRQWITNLCQGLARSVMVITAADEIAGFTSCAVDGDGVGRIPLIATSDDHRRQGIGRALIESALAWFCRERVNTVWVKTQAANYAALALYHRAGFTVGASELTFTAILRPDDVRA